MWQQQNRVTFSEWRYCDTVTRANIALVKSENNYEISKKFIIDKIIFQFINSNKELIDALERSLKGTINEN